ncbi:MAG: polyprenyl synthetase family protein [Chloroflexi bacterium]|nr:polyprenyl synthetase family protein [Chloroflexota bacterium]
MEPPQLSAIYAPVQAELLRVEECLHAISEESLRQMPPLLEYPLKLAGKRVRPAVTLLSGQFYEYDPRRLVPMAASVELFHIATLVHDDIVDKAELRRGKPTVSFLHGQNVAVLLGDYVFARSAEKVCSTGNIHVVSLFAQTLRIVSSGELRQGFTPPESKRSKEHYFEWIGSKTASLFRLASESGAVLSQAPPSAVKAMRDYGWNIGLAFQIVDDILDFVGHEAEMGKPVGADLLHGALTLPVILLLEHYPQDTKLRNALDGAEGDAGVRQVTEMVANSKVIDECYSIACGLNARAREAIQPFSTTAAGRSLHDLTEYVLRRKK